MLQKKTIAKSNAKSGKANTTANYPNIRRKKDMQLQ